MDISGKKAIVFGGTSGIGFATIKMLAQKGASKILAVSRNPDKVKEIPQNVELVKLDVLDETGLKTFFKVICELILSGDVVLYIILDTIKKTPA